jgi:DNA-binding transcriptional MerR regulator
MELQTISQISKQYNISTRTLRYYEQIKLIQPIKKEDYSYRTYDKNTILRIKQIIVLRKLRIPLKQITEILQSENVVVAIEAFQQNLNDIDDEITALSTIKSVIQSFIDRLNIKNARLQLLDDESLLEIVDSLTVSKINFKEDKTMDDLNKASEKLTKLTDRDVRIVYLPSSAVASVHCVGDRPEDRASAILRKFMQTSNLAKIKPDFRHYGFNHPDGTGDDDHGYEYWVTIPDDMDLIAPFVKKRFSGGLYAAHTIIFGAFEEWHWLWEWVDKNNQYEFNLGSPECMNGLLEEHLNYFNQYDLKHFDHDKFQMDLLIPIKEKAI